MCNIQLLVDVWRRCSRAGLDESSRTSSGLAVRRTHHPELGAFAVRWLIVTLALLFCGDVLAALHAGTWRCGTSFRSQRPAAPESAIASSLQGGPEAKESFLLQEKRSHSLF